MEDEEEETITPIVTRISLQTPERAITSTLSDWLIFVSPPVVPCIIMQE